MNPPYGGSEKADVKNHFPADLASSETADLFMSVIMYRLKQNGRVAVILPDGFLFGTDNAKVNIKKKLLSEFNLHTVIRMPHSVFAIRIKRSSKTSSKLSLQAVLLLAVRSLIRLRGSMGRQKQQGF